MRKKYIASITIVLLLNIFPLVTNYSGGKEPTIKKGTYTAEQHHWNLICDCTLPYSNCQCHISETD